MDNLQNDYSIIFSHVQKAYGSNVVINDLNLNIRKGERLILLGPSGCGKTTTLRMIAGFEEITKGELYMDGRVVNDIAPGERNIAMVFQSYALFPHLSVWDNITFGLQLQKLPQAEMEKRARMAMEILHLEGYENKKTHELSGGQKQRVALCRALVKQSPYFLLDEPLSNLDAKLRTQMRREIQKLYRELDSTFIYVTHDQTEAMTLGTKIVVMKAGEIQQIASPEVLYNEPANVFVAGFIGMPPMNFFKGRCQMRYEKVYASTAGMQIELSAELADRVKQKSELGKDIIIGVRPEDMLIADTGIESRVRVYEMLGAETYLYFDHDGGNVAVRVEADTPIRKGDRVHFNFRPEKIHLFDAQTEERI